MMKKLRTLVSIGVLTIGVHSAGAAIIDFEGVAPAGGQTTETNSNNAFNGFNVFVPHGHYVDSGQGLATRPQNGTDWLLHDHFSPGGAPNQPVVITRVGGGLFSATSIDASEWDNSFALGQTLTLTGHLSGGGTVVANLVTDQTFGFQTFGLAGFVGLTQLDIIDSSATTGPCAGFTVCGALAYDNLVVSAVPEPGVLGLLGLGLALAALSRRRSG